MFGKNDQRAEQGKLSIIEKTRNYVRERFEGESSGHDWQHIKRVYETSLNLFAHEQNGAANQQVIELAALLHDIADWKFNEGDAAGSRAAGEWLTAQECPPEIIEKVCCIIARLSFKGAGVETPMETLEGKIVQDADRLDAIGAIGIARAFAYGGFRDQTLFDPQIRPQNHQTFSQYKEKQSTTINHFYEKLLLLKDRMNTNAGRIEAEKRQKTMLQFLEDFFRECHAESCWHAEVLRNNPETMSVNAMHQKRGG
ncbi:MAG: HD domain-containing protein [Sporolactobacillus sp.]